MTRDEKIMLEQSLKKIGKSDRINDLLTWCEKNLVYRLLASGWIIGENEDCSSLSFNELYSIFEDDYKKEREFKLNKFSEMLKETFEWGCNDRAKCLYANAIYSVITGEENYKECEQDFLDYMHENGIF